MVANTPAKCRFESDWGHSKSLLTCGRTLIARPSSGRIPQNPLLSPYFHPSHSGEPVQGGPNVRAFGLTLEIVGLRG